jgi:hypothetical protein
MDAICAVFCDTGTVIEVDPVTLELIACACTVSVPGLRPAVYITVACPLLSVTPLVLPRVAPLLLVDSANITVSPGTALPLASITVAVSVEVLVAFTVVGEAASCTRAGAPGIKLMTILVRKPCTFAVTVAAPAVVLGVKSTCAIPLASVVTVTLPLLSALVIAVLLSLKRSRLALRKAEDSESDPAVVAKVTGTPDIAAPAPFVTWRRTGTALWPSATTAVDPEVVERDKWMALLLLAGA